MSPATPSRPLYRADPDRLLRILAESQFADPYLAFRELYANALDAVRGRDGAEIRIAVGPERVSIEDDGPGLDGDGIEALTTLGGSTRRGDGRAVGRFGVGFASVFDPGLGVAQVSFHAHRTGRGEGRGVRLEFVPDTGGGVSIRSEPCPPPVGCGSRVEVRFDLGRADEDRVERVRACLEEHAEFSEVPTWLDGRRLGRSAEALVERALADARTGSAERALARRCRVERAIGVASIDPGRTEARFRVYTRGVFVTELELPRPDGLPWPRGVFGFARVDGLRLVTSRDAFVEDEAWERALAELRDLVFEVGYAVLRHFEATGDRFARLVLLDALRRGLRTTSPEVLVARADDLFSRALVRCPLFSAWTDRRLRSLEALVELAARGDLRFLPYPPGHIDLPSAEGRASSDGAPVMRADQAVEREIMRKLTGRVPMPAAARAEPSPRIGWWARLRDRWWAGPRAELSLFARTPGPDEVPVEVRRLVEATAAFLARGRVRAALERHLPGERPRLGYGASSSGFAPVAAYFAGEIRFNVAHRVVLRLAREPDSSRAVRALLPVVAHELAHVCHDLHDEAFYRTSRVLTRTLATAAAALDADELGTPGGRGDRLSARTTSGKPG